MNSQQGGRSLNARVAYEGILHNEKSFNWMLTDEKNWLGKRRRDWLGLFYTSC